MPKYNKNCTIHGQEKYEPAKKKTTKVERTRDDMVVVIVVRVWGGGVHGTRLFFSKTARRQCSLSCPFVVPLLELAHCTFARRDALLVYRLGALVMPLAVQHKTRGDRNSKAREQGRTAN